MSATFEDLKAKTREHLTEDNGRQIALRLTRQLMTLTAPEVRDEWRAVHLSRSAVFCVYEELFDAETLDELMDECDGLFNE